MAVHCRGAWVSMFSTICLDIIEAVGSVLLLQALAEYIPTNVLVLNSLR